LQNHASRLEGALQPGFVDEHIEQFTQYLKRVLWSPRAANLPRRFERRVNAIFFAVYPPRRMPRTLVSIANLTARPRIMRRVSTGRQLTAGFASGKRFKEQFPRLRQSLFSFRCRPGMILRDRLFHAPVTTVTVAPSRNGAEAAGEKSRRFRLGPRKQSCPSNVFGCSDNT